MRDRERKMDTQSVRQGEEDGYTVGNKERKMDAQ